MIQKSGLKLIRTDFHMHMPTTQTKVDQHNPSICKMDIYNYLGMRWLTVDRQGPTKSFNNPYISF